MFYNRVSSKTQLRWKVRINVPQAKICKGAVGYMQE